MNCDRCGGVGKKVDQKHKCKNSKGNRTVLDRVVVEVTVDKGCPNHHKYIFN